MPVFSVAPDGALVRFDEALSCRDGQDWYRGRNLSALPLQTKKVARKMAA
jgi:hypothetical protein